MRIKITFLVVALLGISNYSFAQELVAETGQSITSFRYKNSQGGTLNNLQSVNKSYLYVGFRHPVVHKNIFVNVGFSYSGYGAKGSDNALGNYFEWNTTYFGLNLGADIKVATIKKTNFFIKGMLSSEFIVQGTQTINNTVYNLVHNNDFDQTNFFFKYGFMINYPISKLAKFYVQYLGGKSKQLKPDSNSPNQEKLRFVTRNFGLGLLINLKS